MALLLPLALILAAARTAAQDFFSDGDASPQVRCLPMSWRGPAGAVIITNCYVVADRPSRRAIVIDPAAADPQLAAYLAGQGLRVQAILNTHGHPDHSGGNRAWSRRLNVAVHGPRADTALYGGKNRANRPDRFFPDGGVLTLGGMDVEVLPLPGHTPGSVCLRIGDCLFSGDALFAGSVGKPSGSNTREREAGMRLQLDGLRRLLATLPGSTRVFPGHGPQTTVGRERASNPYLAAPTGGG